MEISIKERFQTARSSVRYFRKAVKPYKPYYLGYLFSVFAYTICSGIVIPLQFKDLIDALVSADSKEIVGQAFFTFIVFYGLLSAGNILFRTTANWFISNVFPFAMRDLTAYCFRRIHQKNYQFFTEKFSGALVAKVKRFSDAMLEYDAAISRNIYEITIIFVFTIVVVSFYSLLLAGLFIVWSIIFIAITLLLLPRKMEFDIKTSSYQSKIAGTMADTFTNFLSIKVFSTLNFESKDFARTLNKYGQVMRDSWFCTTRMEAILLVVILIAESLIFFVSYKLYLVNTITLGVLVLIFTYLMKIGEYLFRLSTEIKQITRHLSGAAEMTEILDQLEDADSSINEVSDYEITTIPQQVDIKFKQVDFAYNEQPLFTNLNLEIPAGEKIGLVGHSGGGKSSLFKILLKLVEPQAGAVYLNDWELSRLERDQLASLISYVPQEPEMFHRSILDNIVYSTGVTDLEEVKVAAKKAYIGEMISGLPKGYDTLVGEKGVKLSTGEKQRIVIARAFLTNKPIVMLDEPTSALDSLSEHYIQLALEDLLVNKTVLVIAHRLSTVKKLDRILVMADGQIIQSGKHDELIKNEGLYQELWKQQDLS